MKPVSQYFTMKPVKKMLLFISSNVKKALVYREIYIDHGYHLEK